MKLTVNKEQIIEGLQKAAAIIPAKAGAAYLRSIWLKADEGSLAVMSTDANIEFTGRYPAETSQPGLIGVQGRAFVDLVRQLPTGVLNLTLDEASGNLLLEQGRRVYKLPVSGSEWFQNFSEFPAENAVTWSGDFLQDVLDKVGFCISDDKVCCEASKNEIIRRYYEATNKLALGACNEGEISKIQMLFNQAKITTDFRRTTVAARECLKRTGHTSSAIELEDGTIITGNSSPLLGCSAALLLNVTKHLAGIDHTTKLIPQSMIEPIQYTKTNYLGGHNPRLHTDEVLVALSVLSENDENCRKALEQLPKLRGCQVHCTVMLSEVDRKIFKKLGIGLTCEPVQKKQVQ